MPLVPKIAQLRGHMFYIFFYREKHEKIFLSETIRLKALIFGMKNHPVNLYQVCSNNIPWAKKGLAPGVTLFYIGLYRETHEKSPETTRPRALIFAMEYHLVDFYQVCSKYAPGAKTGPTPGVTRDIRSAFSRYLYVSFKQNSGERLRPSCSN